MHRGADAILEDVDGNRFIDYVMSWGPLLHGHAPRGLVQAVAALPAGTRVVAPQTWGSWFEWAAPHATYFIDSRFELFPSEVWADYAILRGTDPAAAAEVLDRWQADAVVVPAGAAAPAGAWNQLASDKDGAYPADKQVTIQDFHSTVGHALGLDVNEIVMSPSNRPFTVGDKGQVIAEVFA